MNFERLQQRVARAEQLVEGRAEQTRTQWQGLSTHWRTAWTPWRILAAGLATGFLAGRAELPTAATGPRLLQMISAVSALFASAQASVASATAEDAAQTAEAVAEDQAAGDPPLPAEPLGDELYDASAPVAPRPAEAATELSER